MHGQREEVFVVDRDRAGHVLVALFEGVRQRFEHHARLDEVVEGQTASPRHVEPVDDHVGEVHRQVVSHLSERWKKPKKKKSK